MGLRQFLGILRHRLRFIAVTLGLGALLTIAITLATPPSYESKASLWITPPVTGLMDSDMASLTAQQRTQSYANLATDPQVLQQVADRLDAGPTAADLARQVSTTVTENASLLQVEARAHSPELAQNIATVVADEIILLVRNMESPSDSDVPAPIVARLAAKASLSESAVSPNIPLNLLTGIVLSLLAGVAGAVLRNALDTTVRETDDVQQITGLTPMAALPYDPTVWKNPLSSNEASGTLSEAFGVLRTGVQFANLDAPPRVIVVTSSVPGEGKTFAATNLAVSMAKSGRSVLLVDSDMRNPGVAKVLGLENSVGLVTVLLRRTTLEQAMQNHFSGVTFLGTGPQPPNPAEILGTQALSDLLGEARAAFDVVIIDAPPLMPVADAAILLTEVDGALLVVRAGSTNRDQLSRAMARIQDVRGKLLGTVVNQVPMGTQRAPSSELTMRRRRLIGIGQRSKIAGQSAQSVFAAAVPLMLVPVSLYSVPVACVCASALVTVTMALTFGLLRTGGGLLILAFGAAPLTSVHPIGPLPSLELADILFAAGFLLLIPHFFGSSLRLPTAFLVGGVGFFVVGSLSALVTSQPLGPNFGRWVIIVLGVLIVPTLLVWWQPSRRTTIAAAAAYMTGASVSAVATLFQVAPEGGRYLGLTDQPNIMAQSQALSFALAPFLFETVPKRFRWIVGVGSLLALYGIWVSGSRTGLLCVAVLTLLYPLFRRSIPAALAVAGLCFPALLAIIHEAQNPNSTNALGRLLGGAPTEERKLEARAGMELFLSHPLLGDGWNMSFQVHSVYVNVAAGIGIFGLFFYLMILVATLRPLVAVPKPYGLLAAPAVLAAAAFGLLDPGLGNRYVWCVLALALSAERLSALSEKPPDPTQPIGDATPALVVPAVEKRV